MRYKGYVVSYIGESKKVNTDNFFLNGICKESVDEPFLYEENKEFSSRNIYALASGGKSIDIGDELAYIAVDLLRNFAVADFDSINREYFHVANTAITSQVLDRNDEHYEVDLALLSIDRDFATIYNMGDIPVFYYDGNTMQNLAGKAPKQVEMAKDYLNNLGEVQSEIFTVNNVSYIGELSSDMEVVPYTSQKMKMRKAGMFVMCSSDVMKVLDDKDIESVICDKSIKKKNKALAILDKAVKADAEGNYTVEVVVVGHGLAIAERELISLGRWFVIAAICLALCVNSSHVLKYISDFVDSCKSYVQKYFGDEEVKDDFEYMMERDKEESEDNKELDAEGEAITTEPSAELPAETVETPPAESAGSQPLDNPQLEEVQTDAKQPEEVNPPELAEPTIRPSEAPVKNQVKKENRAQRPSSANNKPSTTPVTQPKPSTPAPAPSPAPAPAPQEGKGESTSTNETQPAVQNPDDVAPTPETSAVQVTDKNELPFDSE